MNEIVGVISLEHQWHYQRQETVCTWVGYFTGWTYVLLFIFSYEIIVYLLFLVVSKIRGIQLPHDQCGVTYTRCCAVTVEIVLIFLPLLTLTAFATPPYREKSMVLLVHGVWWGHWTIIVHQPVEHFRWLFLVCSYTALGVAGIIASLIFSIVYFKLSSSFREVRHLLKWTLYVLVFQFVHILMIMCSAACRIYTLKTRTHEQYSLWFLFALAVSLGVLLFPLGYFLCFPPVGHITQIIYHRCCEHKMLLNQNNTTMQSTAPRSSHVSQPSYTFFFASHPDEPSEISRLVSDTGYDSTLPTSSH